MNTKVSQRDERVFFFKTYQNFWCIEKAIETMKKNMLPTVQLSILGQFSNEIADNEIELLKSYVEQSLKVSVEHGFFYSTQLGTVFIIGPLTSIFLCKMNKKVLGSIYKGPYGILRGLGLDEEKAQGYINSIKLGYSLLIIRGFSDDLCLLEYLLIN